MEEVCQNKIPEVQKGPQVFTLIFVFGSFFFIVVSSGPARQSLNKDQRKRRGVRSNILHLLLANETV